MTDIAPDRRTILAAMGGLAVAGIARPAAAEASADARLDALLSAQFEQGLRDEPKRATPPGIETGDRAALRAKYPDCAPDALAARDPTHARQGKSVTIRDDIGGRRLIKKTNEPNA